MLRILLPPARMIDIAVVIVNYNSGRLLGDCLASLASQTRAPRCVVVVDNASTDGSLDAVVSHKGITLLRQSMNIGFAAANNAGIAAATGCDWIATLNPDATVPCGWIAALEAAVAAYPDVDSFACSLLSASDPSRIDGAGDAYHVSGLPWRRLHGAPISAGPEHAVEVFGPCAAGAMYRRAALEACGGFDEDLFCYVEDIDLAFRLRLAGGRSLFLPGAVVYHHGSAITGRASPFQIYHGHRNLVWVFVKNMPGALFWLLLPLHLLLNVASLAWFAARGRGGVIWRAKYDALRGLPIAWRKRRIIQRARRVKVMAVWRVLDRSIPGRRRRIAA